MAESKVERICEDIEATIAKLHDQVRALRAAVAGENPVGQTIAHWQAAWKTRYRADYELTKADAGNLKRLVTKLGAADVCARITRYLRDGDDWYVRQQHPLTVFAARVNAFATPSPQGDREMELDPDPPADCRHTPRCRTDQEHTRRRREEIRA